MLSGWGVGVSRRRRLHPCHAASVGFGATPPSVNKPLGGRVVGECAKGTHLKGLLRIRKIKHGKQTGTDLDL